MVPGGKPPDVAVRSLSDHEYASFHFRLRICTTLPERFRSQYAAHASLSLRQLTALLECIATAIGLLGLVADDMRECRLGDSPRPNPGNWSGSRERWHPQLSSVVGLFPSPYSKVALLRASKTKSPASSFSSWRKRKQPHAATMVLDAPGLHSYVGRHGPNSSNAVYFRPLISLQQGIEEVQMLPHEDGT